MRRGVEKSRAYWLAGRRLSEQASDQTKECHVGCVDGSITRARLCHCRCRPTTVAGCARRDDGAAYRPFAFRPPGRVMVSDPVAAPRRSVGHRRAEPSLTAADVDGVSCRQRRELLGARLLAPRAARGARENQGSVSQIEAREARAGRDQSSCAACWSRVSQACRHASVRATSLKVKKWKPARVRLVLPMCCASLRMTMMASFGLTMTG